MSRGLARPQDTLRLFFVGKHYQQRATAPTTVRQWDREQALGGDISCVKKKLWVMESSFATFTVLYCTIPVLLTFNILPFFYEHSVLVIFLLYKECDMQFQMVFSKQGSLQ
jgi:hypothetical protein